MNNILSLSLSFLLVLFTQTLFVAAQGSTVNFEVTSLTVPESEANTWVQFRILRTGDLTQPASFVLSSVDGTATGQSGDYSPFSFTLEFAPGEAVIQRFMFAYNDDTYEGPESFSVYLSNPGAGVRLGAARTMTVSINDQEDHPKVNVDIQYAVEPSSGRQVSTSLVLTLTNRSVEPVSITISPNGGTATEGADYLPFSTTVNFDPMQDWKLVPLTILGDGLAEPKEIINTRLTNPVNAQLGHLAQNTVEIINAAPYAGQADFNGDGITETAAVDSSTFRWFPGRYEESPIVTFGTSGDVIVPGEYTGDGKTDVAVWRASTGVWWVLRSEDASYFTLDFGVSGDIPAPADFDADGVADFALFRPSTGTWYIRRSTDGQVSVLNFGQQGDKPVPADYDGDWKADIAIFRGNGNATAEWWIVNSTDGSVATKQFGLGDDRIVPADYDGDGKADVSIWRPSTQQWFVMNSANNSVSVTKLGYPNSIPVPGRFQYPTTSVRFAVFTRVSATTAHWDIPGPSYVLTLGSLGDFPVVGAYTR